MSFPKMKPSKAVKKPTLSICTESEETVEETLEESPSNTNETDSQYLVTEEIREAARNVVMNWKLAIFDADEKHLKALQKTREQIEKVESVSIHEYYVYFDGRENYSLFAKVLSSKDDKFYMARIHKNGRSVCGCPDYKFRNRVCKHLVRVAIECLDGEPKGLIYYI